MDIKRSYYEDIELFKSKTVLVWSLILFAFLIVLPWIVTKTHFMGFSVYLLNLIIIHCMVAIGLNILVGYTGQISLGHAGFFAIGAFTTVLFVSKIGLPPDEEILEDVSVLILLGRRLTQIFRIINKKNFCVDLRKSASNRNG